MKNSKVVIMLIIMILFSAIISTPVYASREDVPDALRKNTNKSAADANKDFREAEKKSTSTSSSSGSSSGSSTSSSSGSSTSTSTSTSTQTTTSQGNNGNSSSNGNKDSNASESDSEETTYKPEYPSASTSDRLKQEGKQYTGETSTTTDDYMKDAENFIDQEIDEGEAELLKKSSNNLYNLLLAVGLVAAVVIGMILGIKYMAGSVDEKAVTKSQLMAYFVGCVVVFGAFGIWKLVTDILLQIGN